MTRELRLTSPTPENLAAAANGRLVVTPNARAARALGVEPNSLAILASARLAACNLAAASAYAAHHLLGLAARDVPELADPDGAAEASAATVRELFRAGVDLEALAQAPNPRAARLAKLALAYRQALRARDLADSAEVFWLAAHHPPEPRPLLLYGYPRLGPDEQAFVHALAGSGSVLYVPCGDAGMYEDARLMAEAFAEKGWTVSASTADGGALDGRPHRAPSLETLEYGDMEAEVRGALAHVKRLLLDGLNPADIAIVARDDAFYGPTVLATAWEYEVPVRVFYRIPLAETRLGAWLAQLKNCLASDFAYEQTYRFLAHPLSPFLGPDLRERIRKEHPADLAAWSDVQPIAASLDFPSRDTRGGWLSRFQDLLAAWDLRSRAKPWPVELQALHRFRESLTELASPSGEPISRATFLDELNRLARLCTVEAHPARQGVELHTPLSLFGARCKHVFVLGVAEERLPQRLKDDPVLDYHARKALAADGFVLEGAAEAARRELLSISQLLEVATERMQLSYPKLMADRATLPSSLFGMLGLSPAPAPEQPSASLEEARRVWVGQRHAQADPLVPRILAAVEVESRREAPTSQAIEDEFDGLSGLAIDLSRRMFSASQLSLLGQCAFRWFAERELGAAPLDEVSEDIDPSMRGNLYHKTLEIGMADCKDEPEIRKALLDGLDAYFLKAERELNIPPWPLWEVRRSEHLALLRRAIEGDDFLQEGAKPEHMEEPFDFVWHGFRLRGSMDRVDRGRAGAIIMDYKAGRRTYGKIQDASGKADVDIQLPIYVQVGKEKFGNVERAYYYMLSTREAIEAESDEALLKPLLERMRGQLEQGHFPVQPDSKMTVCQYCPTHLACRKGSRLERKARFA